MSAAIYCPFNIPIAGGTLTFRPADAGPEGKILIEIVTQAGAQTLIIDLSWLDILQEEICRLRAAIGDVAVG